MTKSDEYSKRLDGFEHELANLMTGNYSDEVLETKLADMICRVVNDINDFAAWALSADGIGVQLAAEKAEENGQDPYLAAIMANTDMKDDSNG